MLTDVYFYRLMRNLTHLAVFRFHIRLALLSGWFPNHFLETLASRCSLPLVQVCSNLVSKTMSKGRNDPRNHPHSVTVGSCKLIRQGLSCAHTRYLTPLSASRSRHDEALAQRRQPGYGDRFIAEFWRPPPSW